MKHYYCIAATFLLLTTSAFAITPKKFTCISNSTKLDFFSIYIYGTHIFTGAELTSGKDVVMISPDKFVEDIGIRNFSVTINDRILNFSFGLDSSYLPVAFQVQEETSGELEKGECTRSLSKNTIN